MNDESVLFDGKFKSWINIFQQNNILAPPGVMLFYGGNRILDNFVTGWNFAISSLRTPENKQPFESIEHIIPQKIGARDIWSGITTEIKIQLMEWDWQKENIDAFLENQNVFSLQTNEGEEVIQRLLKIPDISAISISCAQIYRFIDITNTPNNQVSTWANIHSNSILREEVYFLHLMELVRQCLMVARKKQLFVAIFCEGYPIFQLPPDLQKDPDLSVISIHSDIDDYQSVISKSIPIWLEKLKNEKIDEVLSDVENNISDPINLALIKTSLYLADNQFIAAWQTILPHLIYLKDNANSQILLSVSQAAVYAGKLPEGLELLNQAISLGIESLEELNSAYLLAKTLEQEVLQEQLLTRMEKEHPNNKITLNHLHTNHLKNRDFSSAMLTAERLDYKFDLEMCKAFSMNNLSLENFLEIANELDQLDRAYIAAAHEAEYRAEFEKASDLASNIQPYSQFASRAIRIRIRLLSHALRESQNLEQNHIEELLDILKFGALNPKDIESRFAIDELLESGTEGLLSTVILSTMTVESIKESAAFLISEDQTTKHSNLITPSEPVSLIPESADIFKSFWQDFLSNLPPTGVILGQGNFASHQTRLISPSLVNYMLELLREFALNLIDEQDSDTAHLLLHAIILASKELEDKNSDLIGLRILVGGLSNTGFSQKSRDLVETFLLTCVDIQKESLDWRLSQTWAIMADSFNRTGNNLKALQCLYYSFTSFDEFPLNLELIYSNYRLAARIFRDLNYSDYSLEMIALEYQTRKTTQNLDKQTENQLAQVDLSIKIGQLPIKPSQEETTKLLNKANSLLKQSDKNEADPVLSCLASLIRLANISNFAVPQEIEKTFQSYLTKISRQQRTLFSIFATGQPSTQDILSLINQVSYANSADDLSFQLRHLLIIARDAITTACLQNDVDLFLIASTLLSQPSLSLILNQSTDSSSSNKYIEAWNWLLNNPYSVEKESSYIRDIKDVFQNINSPEKFSAKDLGKQLTIETIRSIILPNESIVVLVHDSSQHLCKLVITKNTISELERLSQQHWDFIHYNEWANSFPRDYGKWEPPPDPWSEEKPSLQDVNDSMKNFSLNLVEDTKQVTIIPDAKLFGFPFAILSQNDTLWGTNSTISTAPSINWLISARKNIKSNGIIKKAWLGASDVLDFPLAYLRDRLPPILEDNSFEIIENERPENLSNANLAIITSHGGVGVLDNFRTVTDGKRSFSAEMFANILKGCECVVLFVCHGGRADPKRGTSETEGLVSQLLKSGVRCVVAAPWSLHMYVPETWLPTFLARINDGKSVGESVYAASHSVQDKYNNPCAWSALQVYGDANLIINNLDSMPLK